jgi:hypothetical protein
LEKPFLWIAQKLFGNDHLKFDVMRRPVLLPSLTESMDEEMDLS